MAKALRAKTYSVEAPQGTASLPCEVNRLHPSFQINTSPRMFPEAPANDVAAEFRVATLLQPHAPKCRRRTPRRGRRTCVEPRRREALAEDAVHK